jgi:DNA-binding MarR family transcriptional regulator
VLAVNESRTVGELADDLGVRPPTATGMTERLVRQGLIERSGDPADRRIVRIMLTEQGRRAMREIEDAGRAFLAPIFERLGPQKVRADRDLRRIRRQRERSGRSPRESYGRSGSVAMTTRKESFLFDRWPRFAMRHPWWVIGATVLTLVACAGLYTAAAGKYGDAYVIPGADSQQLVDLLEERFPSTAGDSAYVVVAPRTDGRQPGEGGSRRADCRAGGASRRGGRALPTKCRVKSPQTAVWPLSTSDLDSAENADESDVRQLLTLRERRAEPISRSRWAGQ